MVYDLSSDFQRKSFLARMDNLMEKGAVVELTEKAFRSPNQNRYLHLLIGVAHRAARHRPGIKIRYFSFHS